MLGTPLVLYLNWVCMHLELPVNIFSVKIGVLFNIHHKIVLRMYHNVIQNHHFSMKIGVLFNIHHKIVLRMYHNVIQNHHWMRLSFITYACVMACLSCPCNMPTSNSAFKNRLNTNNVVCERHVPLWVCCVRLALNLFFCYFLDHTVRF